MTGTVNQVYLMVRDVDESRAFYRETLGFEVADRAERRVKLRTGECTLVLEQDFTPETLSSFGLSPPSDPRGEGVIVVLAVPDVDAVYDRVRADGLEVHCEPRDVDWGRRLFLLDDPDGYTLEISQPLPE